MKYTPIIKMIITAVINDNIRNSFISDTDFQKQPV